MPAMHPVSRLSDTGCRMAAASRYIRTMAPAWTRGVTHRAKQNRAPAVPIPFFTTTAVPRITSAVPPMASPTPGIASTPLVRALLLTLSMAGAMRPWIVPRPITSARSVFSVQDTAVSISSVSLDRYSSLDRQFSTLSIM